MNNHVEISLPPFHRTEKNSFRTALRICQIYWTDGESLGGPCNGNICHYRGTCVYLRKFPTRAQAVCAARLILFVLIMNINDGNSYEKIKSEKLLCQV